MLPTECAILHSRKRKLQHLLHSLTIFCLRCPHYWSQNRVLRTDDWNRVPRGCQTHSYSYCDKNITRASQLLQNKSRISHQAHLHSVFTSSERLRISHNRAGGTCDSSASCSVSPALLASRATLMQRTHPLFKCFQKRNYDKGSCKVVLYFFV